MKRCKDCAKRRPTEDFRLNPVTGLPYSRCIECRPRHNAREQKRYVPLSKQEQSRNDNWKRKYGITPADYALMLEKQNGLCAVCETDSPGGGKGFFVVDHCHSSGVVRGLLCWNCNVGAGHLRDDPELVHKMEVYLLQKVNALGEIA